MQIQIIPEVGDQYNVKKQKPGVHDFGFAYTNKYGGTGMSNWDHEPKFAGTATVKITKVWYDDEVGYRCWAKPVNQELIEYLKENGNEAEFKRYGYYRVFVSEHEIEIIK